MPYNIKKQKNGFKVCKPDGKCFSKKPLTKKQAEKQRTAIIMNSNENATNFDNLLEYIYNTL